jgi:asparaginyl-tRNA synthetase
LVKGWVKTVRQAKNVTFIAINDGSRLADLQVVIDSTISGYDEIVKAVATGASIAVTGTVVESPGKEQAVELHAKKIDVLGQCDVTEYQLQKKHHTFEFLRTIAHLRPRTNTFGAVARVLVNYLP